MEETKKAPTPEEIAEQRKKRSEEIKNRSQEATIAVGEGKGRLRLEVPIHAGEKEVTELVYDFTALTGLEYADAMDSMTGSQPYQIAYKQGLALFAAAVAKQMDEFDARDIMERLSITDAVEGVQLATLFFNASARAGFLRILRR